MESIVTCLKCGYDLRGNDPMGKCPECGLAIAVSRSATPEWRSLEHGRKIGLIYLIIAIVCLVVALLVMSSTSTHSTNQARPYPALLLSISAFAATSAILGFVLAVCSKGAARTRFIWIGMILNSLAAVISLPTP
jgi:uncharacterized membrane protein